MKNKIEDNYLKKELYELIKKDVSIFEFIQMSLFDGLWYWDLENPEIDFILMNLKMPLMSGFEATKRIKEFRTNLLIVAQTAYSTKDEKEQAFLAGCDDFISKPIREETFKSISIISFIH